MQTKSSLRQHFRARRRLISSVFRDQSARQLLRLLLQHRLFDDHRIIACYFPHDGEFDITPLIYYAWQHALSVCLPVILQEKLCFKLYEQNTKLAVGCYGIPEPKTDILLEPDLVFLPLVAFDRLGNRLGMGKGFYDQTFQNTRPILIGVAYACQEAKCLPVDPWDVPLDAIITEAEFIRI